MPRVSPGGQKLDLFTDLELITYVPDDGLHIHVHHRELPAHELPSSYGDDVLKALSGHSTREIVEADAKAIARKNQDRILVAIERWLENHKGYAFRHGRRPASAQRIWRRKGCWPMRPYFCGLHTTDDKVQKKCFPTKGGHE